MDSYDRLLQAIRSGEYWTVSPYFFPDKRMPLHIRLVNCGFETRTEASYSFSGLNRGSSEFSIFQYTVAGEGALEYEGRAFRLLPGDAFLVHLPHDHCYRFDPEAPAGFWTHFYCSFSGREAIRIQRIVEAESGPVLHLGEQSDTIRSGLRLIDTLRTNAASMDPFLSSSLLYDFLMNLSRDSLLAPASSGSEERYPEFLRSARRYCVEHLADLGAGVDGMAAASGYSKYHFTRLFRESLGISPGQFLRDMRLRSALRMLQFEFHNIKEISALCGFADESYFCRSFKRKFGKTPGVFQNSKL